MVEKERDKTTNRGSGERTLQDILSDALDQEMIENPPEPMSYEEFDGLLNDYRKARRSRALRIVGIAAMLAIVIICAMVFDPFTSDVGANKNEKEEIITEDGVVIEDGGYGSSGEDNWVLISWIEVEAAKKALPELLMPEYAPDGYEFNKLAIEKVETGDTTYEYIFCNEKNEIVEIEAFVPEDAEMSSDISSIKRIISSKKGDVYIQENIDKIATIQLDGGIMIYVTGDISDKEIVKIIDNIRR